MDQDLDLDARRLPRRPTPVGVTWPSGHPLVEWCDLRDLALTDPFFFDTFLRLGRTYPDSVTWQTGIQAVLDRAEQGTVLEPSGFVFHMGRCGSTLTSRLLASSDRFLVLSEPDAIVGLLDAPGAVGDEERRSWLRALILALGQPSRPSESRYVVKFTSFHVFHLELILELFPNTPWVFLSREPDAVLRSMLSQPTGFMLMDPSTVSSYLGSPPHEVAALAPGEYVARFLAGMLAVPARRLDDLRSGRARLVDYRSLPGAVWTEIAPFFGIEPTRAEVTRMAELSSVYSKDPTSARTFHRSPDSPGSTQVLPVDGVEQETSDLLAQRYRDLLDAAREGS